MAEITIRRGDTLDLDLMYLGDLTGWTKVWFTVKDDTDDTDAQAVIQIVESNPGVATDGLLYIMGAAPTALGNGSITMVNVVSGNITVRLEAVETAKLDNCGSFMYDVQFQTATDTVTLASDYASIVGDITRTV